MTYLTGQPILALDYNTFATLANSMNRVYADLHSGTTTLPNAGFGYGRPPLTSVSVGAPVLASEWSSLFQDMRNCEIHQGAAFSDITPPVPSSGPVTGNPIIALNTPITMQAAVDLLTTNKHNVDPPQLSIVAGTSVTSTTTWNASLVFTFQVNFGAGAAGWNNARYFFNTGGSIRLSGSYTTATTPVEIDWRNAISAPVSPFSFYWNRTQSATNSNDSVNYPRGFWDTKPGSPTINNPLPTTYVELYKKFTGGGSGHYYTTNYVLIEAKLNAAAGTNGIIDFRISLIDADTTLDPKGPGIIFTPGYAVSASAIPGPIPTIINGTLTPP